MQMRVMKYGKAAPELAATANISAFNIANALGGLIGGVVVDSSFGASAIPYAAAIVPFIALLFILSQEQRCVGLDRSGEPSKVGRAGSLKSLGAEQFSPSSC
jgi:DHA1 family inner membrane transport protein